jgi:asparagine synthase (glutamine-hydrolysing)
LRERQRHFEAVHSDDPVTALLNLDLRTSLVDSLLLLTDKMTMATSLEARVPFLDHELIETAARVPARLKVKGTTLRYIQKRAMEKHLPREVFRRRKRGFGCPVGRWFRSELRELLRDTLGPAALRRGGLFEPAAVEAIVEAHEQCREDRSETLLALLTFQIWHEQLGRTAASTALPQHAAAIVVGPPG